MTPPLDEATRQALARAAGEFGTPCYVYFGDEIRDRFARLDRAFGSRFAVSYAVKANPNGALLERMPGLAATLDVSSGGELEKALAAGYPAAALTFSGPGKRPAELRRAVEVGCGELVCESEWELEALDALGRKAGRTLAVFPRINPREVPRGFGVQMSGRPSQFGIDEEDAERVLARLPEWQNLELGGLHVYSGTNALDETAIAENFGIFIEIFTRLSALSAWAGRAPRKLIFGSGFGIPYTAEQSPLDLGKLAELVNPRIDALRADARLADAQCVLEMGRWLVGPAGYYLTSVVNEKHSRGSEIRICDGGMNHHLAACGMLGAVIRRNWPMWKVSDAGRGDLREYTLVGPLCTPIDTLAQRIALPELRRGDVVAVGSSGAYGLSASPTRFIGHPEPREILVLGRGDTAELTDVTGR